MPLSLGGVPPIRVTPMLYFRLVLYSSPWREGSKSGTCRARRSLTSASSLRSTMAWSQETRTACPSGPLTPGFQEQVIGRWEAQVNIPTGFILPGDTPNGAASALARTVVRRAERGVAELTESGDLANPQLLRYLNRLSSLCFVLELIENQAGGVEAATRADGPHA